MYTRLKSGLSHGLRRFFPFVPALFLTLILVRGLELTKVSSNSWPTNGMIWADLLFFLQLLPLFFCLFLVINYLSPKRSQLILFLIGSLWLFIYSALVTYFVTAHVPLGADMLGYSISDGVKIIHESITINLFLLVVFILPILIFWLLLKAFKKRQWNPLLTLILIVGGLIIPIVGFSVPSAPAPENNEYALYTTQNKGAFFIDSLIDYFINDAIPEASEVALEYLDPKFPFLRIENTPDVLSDFFTADSVKPNIVIIQVEGLGRAFSGPKAYLGSFTPFLDELAEKSIYFENFLSAQGRTFAALPSILGSLPFAETGFSDLEHQMPEFESLISIANKNGYQSTYYGGFEMDFDHQGLFMKKAGIGKIVSMKDFDKELTMASPLGFSDRDLMEKVLAAENSKQPTFSFIQTLSMHNPFTVPDQENYLQLVETHMSKLGFTDVKKQQNRPYKQIFASILYTDEALRFYFESYAKLPAYQNTIFIITGDHRLPEIPLSTKIDRYHVPLIIFSPMLKRSVKISAISSHLDIAPSFSVFFKNSYQMKTPEKVTWVGTGLDVNPGFRNIHEYPLKQGKTVLHNYISGLYYLDGGKLFTMGSNLDLEPVSNAEELKRIRANFNQYQLKNQSFLNIKKLKPDSQLVSKGSNHKKTDAD
ncbi:putative sulfatase [Pedobacter sp. CAN_A7]|uniref:LTA synthase family protein n=1 Tax=Pedobacter sp. CAN_A7 TaxID=2787722 RepID=UPI0018C9326C